MRAAWDAVIVQDMGVFSYIRENFPDLDIHASTQMTVLGAEGAAFLKKQGATRVVTARELSLGEIRRIHETVDIGDRKLCPWSPVLLLFGAMPVQQYAGRPQRQPWPVCPALPSSLSVKGSGEGSEQSEGVVSFKPPGYVYH